jgi:hypothetical protein
MGRYDFQSRIGCIGWDGDLRIVQRFGRYFFQCQASLLVFLPKLLVKESSIFVPKFRAVSKDDQSARAGFPGPPLVSLVPGW